MQRSQSCHWSLWKFKVWTHFLSFLTASHLFHLLICSEEKLFARTIVMFEPVILLNIYPAFPKRGHTIHGCDLPLLHLLKLSFFPYRVSKNSSQMKWCYFMLKVKEKFYRQINFKLLYHSENFEICILLHGSICKYSSNEYWHYSVVPNDTRGYGFVKFGDESEQKKALEEFQNATGLGGKAIRISIAVNKR